MDKDNKNAEAHDKTPVFKRYLARTALALIALLYIFFGVSAITGTIGGETAFVSCLIGTMAIPILVWLLLWGYSAMTGKRNIATYSQEVKDED